MEPDTRRDRDRACRALAVGSGGLLLGAALTYVGLVDPHRPGSAFPGCPFKLLTGWNCPGCGGLRMVHDLLHGDLSAAVVDNVFLLVGLPSLVFWVLLRMRQGRAVFGPVTVTVLVALTVVWTVMRNLPGFPLVPTILDG